VPHLKKSNARFLILMQWRRGRYKN